MNKLATYLHNLGLALRNKPNIIEKVRVKQHLKVVYTKDKHGFIKRDMALLNKHIDHTPYRAGDSLAEVAYKAGQHKVLEVIHEKLIKPGTLKLH